VAKNSTKAGFVLEYGLRIRSLMPELEESANLLTDSIGSLFIRLSIPAVVGTLMVGVYQLVDGIFVGQFVGPEGIGAIGLVFPITLLNNGLGSLLGVGASSYFSRELGKGNAQIGSLILGNVTLIALVFSLVMSSLGFFFADEILAILGGQGEILRLGTQYFRVVVVGTFFVGLASGTNMLVRAEGKMRTAMVIISVGAVLNIILDPLLIIVFDMGIRGAGIATIIAQGITAVISIGYFAGGTSHIKIRIRDFRFDREILNAIFAVGFSAMAMPLLSIAQIFMVFRQIDVYGGQDEIVIIGAILKIMNFFFIPLWGIAMAYQPIAGINYGAQQFKRVQRSFYIFALNALIVGLLSMIPLQVFTRGVLGLFVTDPILVAQGIPAMRMYFIIWPIYGIMLVAITYFQALGHARQASFLVMAKMLVFYAPIIYFLPRWFGLNGIWLSVPVSDVVVMAMGVWFLAMEFRYENRLLKQRQIPEHTGGTE
jgi:putative MATE family efflux protein